MVTSYTRTELEKNMGNFPVMEPGVSLMISCGKIPLRLIKMRFALNELKWSVLMVWFGLCGLCGGCVVQLRAIYTMPRCKQAENDPKMKKARIFMDSNLLHSH